MKTIKIFISEFDAEDILSELKKEKIGLYDTWIFPIVETGESVNIEIHLGHEDDQKG